MIVGRLARRTVALLALWLVTGLALAGPVSVSSARVWPAADYTRLTLESAQPIRYQHFSVQNPERLVVDMENVELNTVLKELSSRIAADDPYISQVRVGRFKPGVVRLVLDLKTEVKPQVFTLKPVGEYGHRLVLDVYPAKPVDPLLALLDQRDEAPPPEAATDAPTPAPAETPKVAQAAPAEARPARKPARDSGRYQRLLTVALDAGHGGEDPGAIGSKGTYEKNITLAMARRIKAHLDREPGIRAVLTRDGDYFISLYQRVNKARAVHADLFVSVHADAFIKPSARGSSVFTLSESGATSAAARWLAKRENDADLIGGVSMDVKDPYLAKTLLDLSQTAAINDSMKLARHVLGELGNVNDLHRGHVEQAGFAVLKAPDIPSILVETAFITNPDEERRLNDDAYQDRMAAAIAAGIKRYFAANPPVARTRVARAD